MSKKNYNKISTDAAKSNVEVETVAEPITEEVVDGSGMTEGESVIGPSITNPETKIIYGIVDNCVRLNVRSKPNVKSEVVCVIPAGLKVVVSKMGTTDGFYEVHSVDNGEATEGFHGFCMKNYILIKK